MKDTKDKKDKMKPEHEAKRNVLQHLSDSMSRHMGMGIKDHMDDPMKKVSVEAPDAESLKKGLEVASQLTPKMDEMSKAVGGMMDDDESEEPRDMDEAADDYEETEHEMPQDHEALKAIHRLQDDDNETQMDKLKKAIAAHKKA